MAGKREDLEIVIGADLGGLAADLSKGARMVKDFDRSINRSMPKASDFAPIVSKSMKQEAKEVAEHWKTTKQVISGIAASAAAIPLAGLAIGSSLVIGVHSLSEAFHELKDSINLAAEAESMALSFEVLTGSAETATKTLKELRKYAAETSFNQAEVMSSAKQLIGFGFDPREATATIRMLGDVSAATAKPLGELSYLYGSLMTQDRAYTVDIKQFANAGVPIWKELAGVMGKAQHEMRDMVEEAKVGTQDVKRAFLSMTGPGGIYHGLTARQGQTFAGVREQFLDAVQVAKTKFGKILVEELGLKDAAKDFTHFAETIENRLDGIRPGVRLLGEIGHSVGHIGAEFVRAADGAADFFLKLDRAAFPESYKTFAKGLEDLRGFINSGKQFKLDAVGVNEVVFEVQDRLSGIFIGTLKGIQDIGESLRREIVQPLAKGFDDFFREFYGQKGRFGLLKPEERFRPPTQFEPDAEIVRRYRELDTEIVGLMRGFGMKENGTPWEMNPQMAAEYTRDPAAYTREFRKQIFPLLNLRKEFAGAFEGGENVWAPHGKLLVDGVVPQLKSRANVALGDTGFLSNRIRELEGACAAAKATRDAIQFGLLQQRSEEELRITRERNASDALTALAGGAGVAARELASIQVLDRPTVFAEVPASVREAVKRAKLDFPDPLKAFQEEYENLNAGLFGDMLDDSTYRRARDALVTRTAGQLHLNEPSKLPDAVLAGSQEDARILSNFFAGQQQSKTTDDLLRQILDEIRRVKDNTGELAKTRTGTADFGGGGDF